MFPVPDRPVVIESGRDGATTSFVYDRYRLLYAASIGGTMNHSYDSFGRMTTAVGADDVRVLSAAGLAWGGVSVAGGGGRDAPLSQQV